MSKKMQLKAIVFLCMMIVVFAYFYISKGFSFNIMEDLGGLKDSVEIEVDDLSNSEFIKDVQSKFSSIKDEIEENQEEAIKTKISEEVIEKLFSQDNIIYEYEPWGIKFSYNSLMTKEIFQENEKILLSYSDFQNVNVSVKKFVLEGTFNDWLNSNYDLQSLDKREYNDLVFWMQDLSEGENRIEEYYFNKENDLFTFSLNCPKENEEKYWKTLENIIKSFDLIKDINL